MYHRITFVTPMIAIGLAVLFQPALTQLEALQVKPIRSEIVQPIRNETFNKNGACKERRQGGNPRIVSGLLVFDGSQDGNRQVDPQIAVGGGHVLHATNNGLIVYTKEGEFVQGVSQRCFNGGIDPKLFYDAHNQIFGFDLWNPWDKAEKKPVNISVSETSDPVGAWNTYPISAPDARDGGGIGYSKKWIGYSFPGGPSQTFVLAAADAKAGRPVTVYHFSGNLGHPVATQDDHDELYFVKLTRRNIVVTNVSDSGNGSPVATQVISSHHNFSSFGWPPASPQKSSDKKTASGDRNPKNLVVQSGFLWFSHTVNVSGRAAVQWHQVDLTNGEFVQSGTISDETNSLIQTTIAVNKNLDVLVGFQETGPEMFISPRFAYRKSNDPINTLRPMVSIGEGKGATEGGAWGDYSGSVVDGDNQLDLWTIQSVADETGKGDTVICCLPESDAIENSEFSKAFIPEARKRLPNIIIVYTDDLGYGDLSCYNDDCAYKTPRIDQLAREGIRFTDAHSSSTICSPSRYGLLAGQQIYRSTGRGGGAFEGPGGPSYLKPGTLTLAEMLRSMGYHTGVFGKWHLGLTWLDEDGKRLGGGFENSLLIDYEKSTPLVDGPNQRGFDESFVTPNCPTTDPLYIYIENGMVPNPASLRHKRANLPNPGGKWRWDNDEGWMSPGYEFENADLIFYEKTRQFIADHVRDTPDKPFFALFSTQIAHAPVLPAREFNGKTNAGPRGDFVVQLDSLVGRVLDLVEELEIDDETLILFNSDNGAETVHVDWMRTDHQHDASGGWRGMKRDGWEGGHRVPLIVRWPSRIPAGQVTNQLASTTDVFATLASAIGYELKIQDATDSFDLLPVLVGSKNFDSPVRPHLLTQSFRGEFQIRQGDWKYLDHVGSGGNRYDRGVMQKYALPEKAAGSKGQLYNLNTDPGETNNLYFSSESKRMQLQELLKELKNSGRSAPLVREPIGIENLPMLNR